VSGFDDAFARVLGVEGGFSRDPSDRGGATRYGVTEAVARANGYSGPMEDLPLDEAKRIAKSQYWDVLRLDAVAGLSEAIAHELFDTSYNCGVGVAGKFLQRALTVLNREQKDYPDLAVDGVVGPQTIHALSVFLAIRGRRTESGPGEGETVLLRTLNALQCVRYIEIAEANPSQKRFVYGWIRARVE
jgi:lysozyme family protein